MLPYVRKRASFSLVIKRMEPNTLKVGRFPSRFLVGNGQQTITNRVAAEPVSFLDAVTFPVGNGIKGPGLPWSMRTESNRQPRPWQGRALTN